MICSSPSVYSNFWHASIPHSVWRCCTWKQLRGVRGASCWGWRAKEMQRVRWPGGETHELMEARFWQDRAWRQAEIDEQWEASTVHSHVCAFTAWFFHKHFTESIQTLVPESSHLIQFRTQNSNRSKGYRWDISYCRHMKLYHLVSMWAMLAEKQRYAVVSPSECPPPDLDIEGEDIHAKK